MLSNKSFNIQLLCAVFLLSASCHANNVSSQPSIPMVTAPSANDMKTPLSYNTVDPELKNGIDKLIHGTEKTNEKLTYLQQTIARQRTSRRLNLFLSLALLAETAYIVNKEDSYGIATTIKEYSKKWHREIIDALQGMKDIIKKSEYLGTKPAGSILRTPAETTGETEPENQDNASNEKKGSIDKE